ncbi:MAG: PQQ-binding-like beta-propeller repeat protein [Acidobacteriota bacterium]
MSRIRLASPRPLPPAAAAQRRDAVARVAAAPRLDLRIGLALIVTALIALLSAPASQADENWTHWRGPAQTGVIDGTGPLVSDWSPDGQNLIWRQDFVGRSTPAVVHGRVCANGRSGEDATRQETIVCFDAKTGEKLWQRNFNVYLTAVPWNRVGWGDVTADSETGYVYAQLVNGRLVALDANGELVWEWRLGEDFGRFSGYGGRTNTPVIDGDRLLVHSVSASFGTNRGPADRWLALDKRTGDILWVSKGVSNLKDLNTYSTPVVTTIDGRRTMIAGGADGHLYAFDAHTGESIWHFHLSQRGLNASPVVADGVVFASHSEENVDTGVMGRLVAIDARGSGDITKTGEKWRVEGFQSGFVSPAVAEGRLYTADNSANLVAFDVETGEHVWELNYGTVGKGSPVIADGKIYVTEVNGNVIIATKPAVDTEEGSVKLSEVHLEVPGGRYAEIYGSPAIAYGRIYLTTEEGIYAIGDASRPFPADVKTAAEDDGGLDMRGTGTLPADAVDRVATLRVVPAVVVDHAADDIDFDLLAFDAKGMPLGEVEGAGWSLEGIGGAITDAGTATFTGEGFSGTTHAKAVATWNGKTAAADLRLAAPLPWSFSFDDAKLDAPPSGWLGVGKGAKVVELAGEKVLGQPKAPRGAPRATMFFGPSSMRNYVIQADVKGTREGRRLSDVGVVANGYTLDLQGAHQRIQVISWASERRMMRQFDFPWDIDAWYTMKLRVDHEGEGDTAKAIIRGKVWKRGDPEPDAWTVEVEDALPIDTGAPGLYTFAPVQSYFDNVQVTAAD